jgi:hypothetical protein
MLASAGITLPEKLAGCGNIGKLVAVQENK